MSQSKHKSNTRERIVTQAGSLAKQQGFGTVGVDALMAAANLKGGSFYYHFPKKEALLTAIVMHEIQASRARSEERRLGKECPSRPASDPHAERSETVDS